MFFKFSSKILLGIIEKLNIWRRFLSSWRFYSYKHEDLFVFLQKKIWLWFSILFLLENNFRQCMVQMGWYSFSADTDTWYSFALRNHAWRGKLKKVISVQYEETYSTKLKNLVRGVTPPNPLHEQAFRSRLSPVDSTMFLGL